VISNPTDTVQGLTCLPYEKSMQKMLWLKRRSPAKGLILLASDVFFFGAIIKSNSCLKDTFNSSILVAIGFPVILALLDNSALPNFVHRALQKMLWLKRRSPAKGLILLASDVNFLYPYVEDASLLVPIKLQKQPTTYLLKASKNTSRLIRGKAGRLNLERCLSGC
jgi:tRNA A37 threonylcarbamoyladenosine synthetase subunit TsaC/SUA5/YrdC